MENDKNDKPLQDSEDLFASVPSTELPSESTVEEAQSEEPPVNDETPDLFMTEVQPDSEDLFRDTPEVVDTESTGPETLQNGGSEEPDTVQNGTSEEPMETTENTEVTEPTPTTSKVSVTNKMVNLPLSKIKTIMKLDPDLKLASGDAIALVTKATEMFIETLAKECVVQKDSKKKTIQKRDVDQVFSSIESLAFLEGAMAPFGAA